MFIFIIDEELIITHCLWLMYYSQLHLKLMLGSILTNTTAVVTAAVDEKTVVVYEMNVVAIVGHDVDAVDDDQMMLQMPCHHLLHLHENLIRLLNQC